MKIRRSGTMANFESGVKGYVTRQFVVKVHFPVDFKDRAHIACKYCPFLSSNRCMCQLNKAPVAFPETNIGEWCPLTAKEEDDGI
jgi:hypothetical protein